MKNAILIVISIVAIATSAFAQQTTETKPKSAPIRHTLDYYISGGYGFPYNTQYLKDYYHGSYNVLAGFGYEKSDMTTIILEAQYNKFDFDSKKYIRSFNQAGTATDGDIFIYSLTLGFKRKLTLNYGNFSPYFKANFWIMHEIIDKINTSLVWEDTSFDDHGGFTINKRDTVFTGSTNTFSSFTTHLALGVDYHLHGSWYLFGECRYCICFTKEETTNYVPISVGILYRRK